MSNLPKINTQALWGVIELVEIIKSDPEALKNGSHDYPEKFVDLIEQLVKPPEPVQKVKPVERAPVTENVSLEAELRTLREELDEFRETARMSEDEALMGSYLRLRTSIIQKTLEFQERTYNISQMKQFEEKVLRAIEELMTPEQRTKLMGILND